MKDKVSLVTPIILSALVILNHLHLNYSYKPYRLVAKHIVFSALLCAYVYLISYTFLIAPAILLFSVDISTAYYISLAGNTNI